MDTLDDIQAKWSHCELVEIIPGKVSGTPLVKGTRLPAEVVVSNYHAGSPVPEIAENFDIAEDLVVRLVQYADTHRVEQRL